MKVLFVGEYSGAYKDLIAYMKTQKIKVMWIHDGDSYKKLKGADFSIKYKKLTSDIFFISVLLKIYYLLLDFMGLKGLVQILRYNKIIDQLSDFDVVQLVNTKPLGEFSSLANIYFLNKIFKNNSKVFLSALGDDYTWVKSCLDRDFKYSSFDRMNMKNLYMYSWSMLYLYGLGYKKLDNLVMNNVCGIIPGLYDYYYAYENKKNPKLKKIIPIAVEIKDFEKIKGKDKDKNKDKDKVYPIKIFHGWQKNKELKKGNDIFHSAIIRLKEKYPEKISYEVVSGLSYNEYITKFRDCDVFIDQCYSMDMGVNALLGMASGKVVLSGFEEEVKNYYLVKNINIAINALPDENTIYNEIENLILNPELINLYSENALNFMKKYHSPDYVLSEYFKVWKV